LDCQGHRSTQFVGDAPMANIPLSSSGSAMLAHARDRPARLSMHFNRRDALMSRSRS
jgi:hypothetical protein